MYRRYPAVNTLYIFMFWEVLLDLSVNRETRLVQETLLVSGRHINLFLFFFFSSIYYIQQWIRFTCWQDVAFWGLYISNHFYQKKIYTFFCFVLQFFDDWLKWISIMFCKLIPLIVHYDGIYCTQMLVIRSPHLQKMFFVLLLFTLK